MHDSAAHVSITRDSGSMPQLAYRVRDAARQLGVSERQAWRLVAEGELESFKFGRSRRITHEALVAFVRDRSQKPAA